MWSSDMSLPCWHPLRWTVISSRIWVDKLYPVTLLTCPKSYFSLQAVGPVQLLRVFLVHILRILTLFQSSLTLSLTYLWALRRLTYSATPSWSPRRFELPADTLPSNKPPSISSLEFLHHYIQETYHLSTVYQKNTRLDRQMSDTHCSCSHLSTLSSWTLSPGVMQTVSQIQ